MLHLQIEAQCITLGGNHCDAVMSRVHLVRELPQRHPQGMQGLSMEEAGQWKLLPRPERNT